MYDVHEGYRDIARTLSGVLRPLHDLFYDQIDDLGEDVTAYAAADHPADVGMLALELPIDAIETLEGMAGGQDVTEFAQGILIGVAGHHVEVSVND